MKKGVAAAAAHGYGFCCPSLKVLVIRILLLRIYVEVGCAGFVGRLGLQGVWSLRFRA